MVSLKVFKINNKYSLEVNCITYHFWWLSSTVQEFKMFVSRMYGLFLMNIKEYVVKNCGLIMWKTINSSIGVNHDNFTFYYRYPDEYFHIISDESIKVFSTKLFKQYFNSLLLPRLYDRLKPSTMGRCKGVQRNMTQFEIFEKLCYISHFSDVL